MGPDAFGGNLANAVALMHPHESPRIVLKVQNIERSAGRQDVGLAEQISNVLAVGENPCFVVCDALGR